MKRIDSPINAIDDFGVLLLKLRDTRPCRRKLRTQPRILRNEPVIGCLGSDFGALAPL